MKKLILSLMILFAMVCQPIFAGHIVYSRSYGIRIDDLYGEVYYEYECQANHTNPSTESHPMDTKNVKTTRVYSAQYNATLVFFIYMEPYVAAKTASDLVKEWEEKGYIPAGWYEVIRHNQN